MSENKTLHKRITELEAERNGWKHRCHVLQMDVCESVRWFAHEMERKIKANRHKGGWDLCDLQYLSMRLTQERKELKEAIASKDPQRIIDECADVANFAMMIAEKHKVGALRQLEVSDENINRNKGRR